MSVRSSVWLAIIGVVASIVIFVLSFSVLWTIPNGRVTYWSIGYVAYIYPYITLLPSCSMLILSIVLIRSVTQWWAKLLLLSSGLGIALLCAGIVFMSSLLGIYEHIDQLTMDDNIYLLGRVAGVDGYSSYPFCVCNKQTKHCHCHKLCDGLTGSAVKLQVDAGQQRVVIVSQGKTVYTYGKDSHCRSFLR